MFVFSFELGKQAACS